MHLVNQIFTVDKPLFLAPMEDITDPPFRKLCRRFGADVVVTEFIASEALVRNIDKSIRKMHFDQDERPAGIQIFGTEVAAMVMAAQMAENKNPDFIDINFGCPVRKIAGKGCGAGMLRDIPKMLEITSQVVKNVNIPVSVKTRLGWDEKSKVIETLAEMLQDCGISFLTIHGRTRSQMYSGKADWTMIGNVKNNPRIQIPVVGNGDIIDEYSAYEAFEKYGVDGIMIGRGAVGRPWVFQQIKHYLKTGEKLTCPGIAEIISIVKEHLQQTVAWKGPVTGLYEFRQHLGQYFKGLPDIKHFRKQLLVASDTGEIDRILNEIGRIYA